MQIINDYETYFKTFIKIKIFVILTIKYILR